MGSHNQYVVLWKTTVVAILSRLLRPYSSNKATAKPRKPQIPPIDSQMSQIASRRAESEEEVARRLTAGRLCVIGAEICGICDFARKGIARIGASTLPQPCKPENGIVNVISKRGGCDGLRYNPGHPV